MINSVHEVLINVPFPVLLSNFSARDVYLHKGTVVGVAARHPLALIALHGPAAQEMASVLNITTTLPHDVEDELLPIPKPQSVQVLTRQPVPLKEDHSPDDIVQGELAGRASTPRKVTALLTQSPLTTLTLRETKDKSSKTRLTGGKPST